MARTPAAPPRYFHGTKHPYAPGDVLVGGLVNPTCGFSEDGEPTPGCDCGCDARVMVWALTDLETARWAAENRVCLCGADVLAQVDGSSPDHRPRVFEVALVDPVEDPCNYGATSVMATAGRIVREVT